MILSGDIGGTKTILALFDEDGPALRMRVAVPFESRKHPTFEELVERFLHEHAPLAPSRACFGVAGPVICGEVQATNLPWRLDEATLASVTGAQRVRLVNDLEAMAYGLLFVSPASFAVLQEGERRRGNVAVIAAGTGLGQAMLHWDGGRHHPIASEGGHADFAARDALELELFAHLSAELGGHVSYERVLSGPGLARIYAFLRQRAGSSAPPDVTRGAPDPAAAISAAGLGHEDPVARETLRVFASIYGVEAGNCALCCTACGGVLIGGGIAAKILPALTDGHFLRAFRDKGRMSELMSTLHVAVSREPFAALSGAAHLARELSAAEAP